MIEKKELIQISKKLGLTQHTVEKDYVLGWALYGISQDKVLSNSLVFKGGTCLKKCYFGSYRFSEDLDFTMRRSQQLTDGEIRERLGLVCQWVEELCGVQFEVARTKAERYANKAGRENIQGKIYYVGPLQQVKNPPSIKLDITPNEDLVCTSVQKRIIHEYSDSIQATVSTYSLEEVFSEKLRALIERMRARDLYDVVRLFEKNSHEMDTNTLALAIRRKLAFKGLPGPSDWNLIEKSNRELLLNEWEGQLSHQLPELEDFDGFWTTLPHVIDWVINRVYYNHENV